LHIPFITLYFASPDLKGRYLIPPFNGKKEKGETHPGKHLILKILYSRVAGAQTAWEDVDQVSFVVPRYSHRQAWARAA
jgi:hypothetical protein